MTRRLCLVGVATICATALGCAEPIRIVDGCTVPRETNAVVADVLVYPNEYCPP